MLFFWNSLFRVQLKWIGTRIIFFSHSQPVPSSFGFKRNRNDIFNFFAIFLEFLFPGPIGMVQYGNLLFLSFSASPVPFWLEKKPYCCFLIFWIFLLFFWNSLFRVRFEWIGMIIFFFLSFSAGPYPVLALKEAILIFFNFLNFFAIFSVFYIPDWLGTNRNDFFFSHSQPVPSHFGLKRSHNDVF